jgi:hypothetical protein
MVRSLRGVLMNVMDASPAQVDEESISFVSLSVVSGDPVTLWSAGDQSDTQTECELQLAPDRPAIVGRSDGYPVPYLDPAYRPTTMVPGTRQSVLLNGGHGRDLVVSRGHFMLKAAGGGVTFVNGVPRPGGGIRPPTNGTVLVNPNRRNLEPGEEVLIEAGTGILLRLPNGSDIRIEAR